MMTVAAPAARLDARAITDAAIEIADADGPDAVSMRRVGASLGVSAMALYRHIPDREALLVSMAARVSLDVPPVSPEATHWRDALAHLARTTWQTFEAHRWLHSIVVSPTRLLDLTTAAQTDAVLAALTRAGLSTRAAHDALVAAAAIPIGIAAIALPPVASRPVETVARASRALRSDSPSADSPDAESSSAESPSADSLGTVALAAGRVDASVPASPTPLADEFRSRPIDAERGRAIFDFTLRHFLDGVQATL